MNDEASISTDCDKGASIAPYLPQYCESHKTSYAFRCPVCYSGIAVRTHEEELEEERCWMVPVIRGTVMMKLRCLRGADHLGPHCDNQGKGHTKWTSGRAFSGLH